MDRAFCRLTLGQHGGANTAHSQTLGQLLA